ncbi:MAG: hypothetical protein WC162_03985 [Sphaerochaetaceae bacterium]
MTLEQRKELIKFTNCAVNVYGILTKNEFYKIFKHNYKESNLEKTEILEFLESLFLLHLKNEILSQIDQKQLFIFTEFIDEKGQKTENKNEVLYFAIHKNFIVHNFIYLKTLNFKNLPENKEEENALTNEINKLHNTWKQKNLTIVKNEELFEYEFPTALYFSTVIEKTYLNLTGNVQYNKVKFLTSTTSYYYFLMIFGLEDYTLKSFIQEMKNSGASLKDENQQKEFIQMLASIAYNLPIWPNRGVNSYSLEN